MSIKMDLKPHPCAIQTLKNTEKSILAKARHGFKKDLEELFESCVIFFGIQFQDTRKKLNVRSAIIQMPVLHIPCMAR